MNQELQMLYEDKDMIVCVKPAGMPSQSDRTGDYDLTSRLLNHLAEQARRKGRYQKEPPYLAVVHRLDRPVGGVMVFAKTKRAAADLSCQVREHRMTKRYFCVITGCSKEVLGQDGWQILADYLSIDKRTNLSRLMKEPVCGSLERTVSGRCKERCDQPKRAELCYQILETIEGEIEGETLTEVELLTGRHHQIRVQMTRISHGIWGDRKYNQDFIKQEGQLALFSHELIFAHPVTGEKLVFTAVPEGGRFARFRYIQRLRER